MRISRSFLIIIMVSLTVQVALCGTVGSTRHRKYVIVTDANDKSGQDPYERVVRELAKLRNPSAILNLDANGLEGLVGELQTLKPRYVALVVHPERIEDNFVGGVFEGLTGLDDDPYIDCAYGYITGATPQDALRLVRNTADAEAKPNRTPKKFAVIAHTFAQNDLAPFAVQEANRYEAYGYQAAQINPVDNSPEWNRKAKQEIQKLNGASLVLLAGHGMGDVSCAIHGDEFGRIRLQSAIVVNGTCHSAVTNIRHDSRDRFWTIQTTRINPEHSVCLNFIKAGAVGQFASTASSSWTNVGFTVTKFFNEGRSLGEALQQSLNDKIRHAGIKKVHVIPFQDAEKSPQALGGNENPGGIQSISRVILIGDPAYRPFPQKPVRVPTTGQSRDYDSPPSSQMRVRRLIEELSNPNAPRFKALNEIIRVGRAAVPALIAEMKINDNWQIPKALGAIGDKRAIGPLIEKLQRSDWSPMRDVVSEALEKLTGENLGTDAKAWKTWWEKEQQRKE
jgi:hypothetical protein